MHSMCAPRVTRQMSRRYSQSPQTLSSTTCETFPIAVMMRSRNSGSISGSAGTSQEDHDVQIAVGTLVEPPQNCYIAQIPRHTNYDRSVRQPFPSSTDLRFSRGMTVATIGPFQMLRLLCVIYTNFTILRHFLLKLWCNEILR
jgi:hypothetical protein